MQRTDRFWMRKKQIPSQKIWFSNQTQISAHKFYELLWANINLLLSQKATNQIKSLILKYTLLTLINQEGSLGILATYLSEDKLCEDVSEGNNLFRFLYSLHWAGGEKASRQSKYKGLSLVRLLLEGNHHFFGSEENVTTDISQNKPQSLVFFNKMNKKHIFMFYAYTTVPTMFWS